MQKFKLNALMLALFAANSAIAATEEPPEETSKPAQVQTDLEVIEVRGFSRSLIQSLNQKRFSDTVSELSASIVLRISAFDTCVQTWVQPVVDEGLG